MLSLTRRKGQSIMIGDDVEIVVTFIGGSKVQLGSIAPKDISVHRKEVWNIIQEAKNTDDDPYEVVIKHTDPIEKNTAAVLKWERRAKVAEEALKEIVKDRNSPPILCGTWEKTSRKWEQAWSQVTNIAKYALKEYGEIK